MSYSIIEKEFNGHNYKTLKVYLAPKFELVATDYTPIMEELLEIAKNDDTYASCEIHQQKDGMDNISINMVLEYSENEADTAALIASIEETGNFIRGCFVSIMADGSELTDYL